MIKVKNYSELKTECDSRGWDVNAYLDEIESHLFRNGGYGRDVAYYGEYYDKFDVVVPAMIEIEKGRQTAVIPDTDEMLKQYDDWEYVMQLSEPIYVFVK